MSSDTLQEAFGPTSLGIIIVRDLPPEFPELRRRLLFAASQIAKLPAEELGMHNHHRRRRHLLDLAFWLLRISDERSPPPPLGGFID